MVAEYLGAGIESLMSRYPFLVELRQKGLVMALRIDRPDGGMQLTRALFESGIWAMFAGFDPSVVQFKPGLLIDRPYCDEALQRLEDALRLLQERIR